MKKMLVLFAALIAAAACAAPTPNLNTTPTANTNSAGASATPLTEAEAIAKERAAWDAIRNKDYDAFAAMLASDSLEVSPGGVYEKAVTVANIKEFEPTQVEFSDWKVLQLDKDAFVVTYAVKTSGKYKGKEFPTMSARASSAWVNRENKWVSVYHQECDVKPATPPPAAKATPANATASPAISPATATLGPDVVANEKTVWDMFKNRNTDAFSAVLADDFIEIEPGGVYDKAGTIKTVPYGVANVVLSDWKTVKIDDDASLVTYFVKMPGMSPNGERHSTIWTSRDGKWMVRFHHGTPVVPEPAMSATPKTSPAAAASPRLTPSPK